MASLLEQPSGTGLGLRGPLERPAVAPPARGLAGLALGRVQHLGALALALLAIAVDVALALLEVTLAAGHLLLGPAELGGRGGLGIALDRVGHLGRGSDHVERVHADGVRR